MSQTEAQPAAVLPAGPQPERAQLERELVQVLAMWLRLVERQFGPATAGRVVERLYLRYHPREAAPAGTGVELAP